MPFTSTHNFCCKALQCVIVKCTASWEASWDVLGWRWLRDTLNESDLLSERDLFNRGSEASFPFGYHKRLPSLLRITVVVRLISSTCIWPFAQMKSMWGYFSQAGEEGSAGHTFQSYASLLQTCKSLNMLHRTRLERKTATKLFKFWLCSSQESIAEILAAKGFKKPWIRWAHPVIITVDDKTIPHIIWMDDEQEDDSFKHVSNRVAKDKCEGQDDRREAQPQLEDADLQNRNSGQVKRRTKVGSVCG